MEQGWIKLHRQIGDNLFLMHDQNAFNLFIKLLIFADSRTGKYVTGRRRLADLTGMNPNTVYKVLIRLEDNGMIRIESNAKYSILHIVNWSKYQQMSNRTSNHELTDVKVPDGNRTRNHLVTTREPHGNHTVTLNKNKELRIKNIDTKVSMSSSENSTGQMTYKKLFYQIVEALGFSNRTILTKERLGKLKTRLSSYEPAQLIEAARNLGADGRMQGDNEQGKRWGNVDYLLRTDTNVAKYLEDNDAPKTSKVDQAKYLNF